MIDYKIREKALERIMGPSQTVHDFLIDGEYQGFPLNQPLPENTPAHIIKDILNIYLGAYDNNGFFECCLEEFAAMYVDVKDQREPKHHQVHIKDYAENLKKTGVWMIYCLSCEQVNKDAFIQYLSPIKYPQVLDKYFNNFQNNVNDKRGSLEKNYSILPWDLNQAKTFTAFSDKPEINSIYQFIKHFPVEDSKNSFSLKNSAQLEKVLDFTETQIINGVNKNIIFDIWEHTKVELPKAFEFNTNYSLRLERTINSWIR